MVTRSNVKLGLSGALLLIAIGSFSACTDLPTGVDDGEVYNCIFIDGIVHCHPE